MKRKRNNIIDFKFNSFFTIYFEDDSGKKTCIFNSHNMATQMASEILCQMLYEHAKNCIAGSLSNSRWYLKEFRLGNRGEGDNPPVNVVPDPDPEAEGLVETDEDNIAIVPVTDSFVQDIDGDLVVVFKGTLEKGDSESDFNGKTYSEIGIFTNTDDEGENSYCLAIKNNPSYIKDETRKLILLWGIHLENQQAS